jgi:uncharacterized integral membrane protein (TIGR00698 family)
MTLRSRAGALGALWPGVALALTVAAAATFLSQHYGAPAMLFALLIGMAFNHLSAEGACLPGLAFASTTLLRTGVALLGARISLTDVAALGAAAAVEVAGLIALTIGAGFLAARALGRDWRFALLTGGAVGICGAAAAMALAAALPRDGRAERDALFTVVAVTALSTVAMVAYPVLFGALGLGDAAKGFLIGATIHDVAQVVGAGYSVSTEAGDVATVVKLMRVAALPLVLLLVIAALRAGGGAGGPVRVPGFLVAFAGIAGANALGLIPPGFAAAASDLSRWLLVTAIAALGVRTSLKALGAVGGGHLAVLVAETLALLGAALALVMLGGAG